MTTVNVVSCSGGKDSTATYLLAMERTGGDFQAVFADTGNEHPAVYEYLSELPRRTGGPEIQTVRADFSGRIAKRRKFLSSQKSECRGWTPATRERVLSVLECSGIPFLDLALWLGMFPTQLHQFCSQYLKRLPIMEQVYDGLVDAENTVMSWQGMRWEESLSRSALPEYSPSTEMEGVTVYRPILDWTVEHVVDIHRRHGTPLNPLYAQGFSRVGCFPCINAQKHEIRCISLDHSWAIDKVRNWEKLAQKASKTGCIVTFFHRKKRGVLRPQTIDEAVMWSKTLRGGKTYDLGVYMPPASPPCALGLGLCE